MTREEAAAKASAKDEDASNWDDEHESYRDGWRNRVEVALAAADAHDAANGVHRNSLDEKTVLDFINERIMYVRVCRNNNFGDNEADYWRYQGHMEARRQLAQALGYTVPYELGEKTVLAAAVKEDGE